jgi:protein-tyrosine phosphatase
MQFEKVMGEIAMGIRRGSLLVHCFGGMSRAPVICAAWLARCGYASIDAALAEIAELRPIVDPSPTLLASVRRLL